MQGGMQCVVKFAIILAICLCVIVDLKRLNGDEGFVEDFLCVCIVLLLIILFFLHVQKGFKSCEMLCVTDIVCANSFFFFPISISYKKMTW